MGDRDEVEGAPYAGLADRGSRKGGICNEAIPYVAS